MYILSVAWCHALNVPSILEIYLMSKTTTLIVSTLCVLSGGLVGYNIRMFEESGRGTVTMFDNIPQYGNTFRHNQKTLTKNGLTYLVLGEDWLSEGFDTIEKLSNGELVGKLGTFYYLLDASGNKISDGYLHIEPTDSGYKASFGLTEFALDKNGRVLTSQKIKWLVPKTWPSASSTEVENKFNEYLVSHAEYTAQLKVQKIILENIKKACPLQDM